jgi:hypothetical protein
MAVSAPAIKQDKKLKKFWGFLSFAVSLFFLVLCFFNLDYVKSDFWHLIWYSSLMSYICAAILFFGIGFYSFFFYKFFFEGKLRRASAEYYRTSNTSNDLTLALYDTGDLKRPPRATPSSHGRSSSAAGRTENVVYLEFNLANQLFVAKDSVTAAGYSVEDFMAYANAQIEEAKLAPDEDEELDDEELLEDEDLEALPEGTEEPEEETPAEDPSASAEDENA